MAWITATDINRLISETQAIRLTDDTNDPSSTADANIIADVISEVTDEIKAELSGRYSSNCTAQTASPMITGIAKAMAMLKLIARRPDMAATNAQVSMVESAMERLGRIRDGEISVPGWSEESAIQYGKPEFDEDAPESFEQWIDERDEVSM